MRISIRQLSQHKQSFLSSSKPVRWEKGVYLILWAVIRDEGRNITYFEAVLQSCKPLHSDIYQTQCCEQHQTLLLKEASLPQSMGGPGASLQTASVYPARSWINPDPFLSPHLEHGWKLKTIFFSLRGNFVLTPAELLVHGHRACISCSWQDLSQRITFSFISKSSRSTVQNTSSSLWCKATRLKVIAYYCVTFSQSKDDSVYSPDNSH